MKRLGLFIALSAFCLTAIAQTNKNDGFVISEGLINKINSLYTSTDFFDHNTAICPIVLGNYVGGFATVRVNGTDGFAMINKNGDEVLPFNYYEEINNHYNGYVSFKINKKWGMYGKNGVIIQPQYDFWFRIENGMAEVERDRKKYIIDSLGNVIADKKQYDNFSICEGGLIRVEKNDKWGVIDRLGNIVIPIKYMYLENFYNGTTAWAMNDDKKWGKIDMTGKTVIPFVYDEIKVLRNSSSTKKARKYDNPYVIITAEDVVIQEQYSDLKYSSEESLIWAEKKYKFGLLDKAGRIVVTPQFDDMYDFRNGYAWVKKNGRWGLIDKKGKLIIPYSAAQYDNYGYFQDGLAWVEKNGKYGVINITGKIVIPLQYEDFSYFENGFAWVKKNGKRGVIKQDGSVVIPFNYNFGCESCDKIARDNVFIGRNYLESSYFQNGSKEIIKNGKWGLTDNKGNMIAPTHYDIITRTFYGTFLNGLYYVEIDGEKGFIDNKGSFIPQKLNKTIADYDGDLIIVGHFEGAFLVQYKFKYKEIPITVMGYMDKSENCTITDELIKNIVDRIK